MYSFLEKVIIKEYLKNIYQDNGIIIDIFNDELKIVYFQFSDGTPASHSYDYLNDSVFCGINRSNSSKIKYYDAGVI